MKKLTIEYMQGLAKKNGGKCLSKRYINSSTKLKWECEKGHQWTANYYPIKKGHWCPKCAGVEKLTINEMHKIANRRGGKCLSNKYIGANSKLKWQCAKGHRWEAKPGHIKSGHWCPKCGFEKSAEAQKLTIEEMQRIAIARGGICLSTKYINIDTKLKWQCKYGHQWEAIPYSIKKGHWCPQCGYKEGAEKQKATIEEMQQIARTRGGKCLTEKYIDGNTKLKWECREGHQWEATPGNIKSGKWCRKCAGLEKLTIEEMQEIAKARGGKCVSSKYNGANTLLKWECAEGHQWEATPNNIKRGQWCNECSTGLGERICREFFQQIFGKIFPKARPKWLVNNEGNQMELDGYCPSLRIAFEHQGLHHYSIRYSFTKNKAELKRRKELDKIKIDLCKQRGILLIQIPEVPTITPVDNIKNIIKKACELNHTPLPKKFDDIKINLLNAYRSPHIRNQLNLMHKIAIARGGKCLSKKYVNSRTKLLWECAEGHQWESTPGHIGAGQWCPKCGHNKNAEIRRLTIEEMKQIANGMGGKCLSVRYINSGTKLKWECKEGHTWEAKPSHVKDGHWCPKCADRKKGETQRLTIEEMQKIAKKRGGKCLSATYKNSVTKLEWQCKKGHNWFASPSKIKLGQWCPICAGKIVK